MDRDRIVIDTNVILSRAIKPSGPAAEAFDVAIADYDLLQSEATFAELAAKLRAPKLAKYIAKDDARALLEDIRAIATFTAVDHTADICRDAKDNKFLDLAVCGHSKYIITGDRDLTVLGEYRGVTILTPGAFLERRRNLTSSRGPAADDPVDHRHCDSASANPSLTACGDEPRSPADIDAARARLAALESWYQKAQRSGPLDAPEAQSLLAERARLRREYLDGPASAATESRGIDESIVKD